MKILSVIAVSLCILPATAAAQVKDSVDRFTGKSSLTYASEERIRTGGRPHIMLTAIQSKGGFKALLFFSSSRGWRYLDCQRVNWLADGVPLETGPTEHDGRVGNGGSVIEHIDQFLSKEQVATLGRAQKAELRVCTDEYSLTEKEKSGFRAISAITNSSTLP